MRLSLEGLLGGKKRTLPCGQTIGRGMIRDDRDFPGKSANPENRPNFTRSAERFGLALESDDAVILP